MRNIPIELAFEFESIAKEIRKILKIKEDEIIDSNDFINKVEIEFKNLFIFKKGIANVFSINNRIITITYDYWAKDPSKNTNEFIMNSICYGILNMNKLDKNYTMSEDNILYNKEAEYLKNEILLPKKLFIHEMIYSSKCDAYANIDNMARKFKVKEHSILSRGRDLMI